MEITSHFDNIEPIIIETISLASKSIDIAVAWFTSHQIFEAILKKMPAVRVRLIIINDDVNNRVGGLDFQRLISAGGNFYFSRSSAPMHNKYCIVDNKYLITGSYNYTYYAKTINEENVVRFSGCSDIIESYQQNFERLLTTSDSVAEVKSYLEVHPYESNIYSYNNYILKDAYHQHIELEKCGRKTESANLLHTILQKESQTMSTESFVIEKVVYEQWKSTYFVDKITVLKGEIIVHFRTTCITSCWVYGPQMLGTWTIQTASDPSKYMSASRIKLLVNNRIVTDSVSPNTVFYISTPEGRKNNSTPIEESYLERKKDGSIVEKNGNRVQYIQHYVPSNSMIECELHFLNSDFKDSIIDLIEGRGSETKENHWHAFKINLKINRKALSE